MTRGYLSPESSKAGAFHKGWFRTQDEGSPEEYAQENGLAERLRFQPGDFYKDPFPKADVITMGHILYDWNLETKEMLIRKAYDAVPEGGALIVYEAIIDDERRQNSFGLL